MEPQEARYRRGDAPAFGRREELEAALVTACRQGDPDQVVWALGGGGVEEGEKALKAAMKAALNGPRPGLAKLIAARLHPREALEVAVDEGRTGLAKELRAGVAAQADLEKALRAAGVGRGGEKAIEATLWLAEEVRRGGEGGGPAEKRAADRALQVALQAASVRGQERLALSLVAAGGRVEENQSMAYASAVRWGHYLLAQGLWRARPRGPKTDFVRRARQAAKAAWTPARLGWLGAVARAAGARGGPAG